MWHARVFENTSEAAAFVAALSRWLDSPAATPAGIAKEAVEIRAEKDGSLETVNLFFNDAARDAALKAFPPGLKVSQWPFDVPDANTVILNGRALKAMGAEDVERSLAEL